MFDAKKKQYVLLGECTKVQLKVDNDTCYMLHFFNLNHLTGGKYASHQIHKL